MQNVMCSDAPIIEYHREADYDDILRLQQSRFDEMVSRRRNGMAVEHEWLMMVEHRPVYTLGRHAEESNLINPGFVAEAGIPVRKIARGGDITYHGPGQITAYPLIDIARRSLGVKDYVNILEESVIQILGEYNIEGRRIEGATGVWVGSETNPKKICAIGVRLSRFVTMHGLALNVNTPLHYFSAINPCGFTDKGVTSITVENPYCNATWDNVAEQLAGKLTGLLRPF